MTSDIQQTPFVKQLAANDRKTRDAALSSLTTYLSGRRELPPLELLKLHKGLFYCMWMSDRPLPQQALANSLASLVTVLPPGMVIPFLRAFWQTMAREWTNIDVLRMEKFLLVTRRYLAASFEVLKKRGKWEWKQDKEKKERFERIAEMVDLLKEIPCNVEDMKIPNGMRYHVIDIYVDELERVGVLGMEEEQREELLEAFLLPLRELQADSPTKTVRQKAKEALADERLPGNEAKEDEKEEEEEGGKGEEGGEWGGFED